MPSSVVGGDRHAGALDLVTVGETMGVFAAVRTGPLRVGAAAAFTFAGAESNVAIGMSRLGHDCAWIGRLGDDAVGQAVLDGLRGESVDVSSVATDAGQQTALLVREDRTADRVRVDYHRRCSAGSRLSPADIDPDLMRSARLLHVTGITPALSESCCSAVRFAVQTAREAGIPVSFDVNYRSRLWPRGTASRELAYLLESADLVFAGVEEGRLFTDTAEPEDVARSLFSRARGEVVLKSGAVGALALVDGVVHRRPAVAVSAVDPVGAGDAFVAGYLSGWLSGLSVSERLERACVCGAFAASTHGDWEGAPRLADLSLLAGQDVVR